MTNVIPFSIHPEPSQKLPRHRVFYIGYRYAGAFFVAKLQHLYLKRKGVFHGARWCSMITLKKYNDFDTPNYSTELEEFGEEAIPVPVRVERMLPPELEVFAKGSVSNV